jgi:two-component system chemotaxis sensor kinase CheA
VSFSPQELEEFKAEALELLDLSEKSLLALDQGAEFRSAFDTVFRGFHNLKGAAGMMELLKLQAHTHELENILMGFKEKTSIPKEYISLFLRGIDAARSILDGEDVVFSFEVQKSTETPSPSVSVSPTEVTPAPAPMPAPVETAPVAPVVSISKAEAPAVVQASAPTPMASEVSESAIDEFVTECGEIIERVSKMLEDMDHDVFGKESIDALYRDVHSLKGSSYLFSYTDLGDLAHAMESSLEHVRSGTHKPSKELMDTLFKGVEFAEVLITQIQRKEEHPNQKTVVQMLSKKLETASSALESTASTPAPVAAVTESAPAAPVHQSEPEAHGGPAGASAADPAHNAAKKEKEHELSSVRVPVALLDNLMTLMGEMVLVRNQVLQHSSRSEDLELVSMSKRLNLVTSEIQGEMMKTRMQPVGNILGKFNRVVRDLSQELSKKININLFGQETEIDKTLLEAIKDPLTHIVRNSCDHGIETPDVRAKAGKPEFGTINIKAYHEGGQVIIEVSDDGKGLHRDVLLKKATEKGLITEQQAAKLSEKEIFNLIFAPGFSTAAKVTNVSGRGVGMDVVRTNVEKIGGVIDLTSVQGRGTSIKLKIPLTLAIIPALIVKCGDGTFAIPQVKLVELVRVDQAIDENKIEFLHGVPVYRLRGNILPLVDLNQLLKVRPDGEANYKNATFNIAVLSAETSSFGVIIDEIKDTADIVVKPLNLLLKSLQVYSGATILGDGSIALILDVNGIAKVAKLNSHEAANHREQSQADEKLAKNSEIQDFLVLRLNSPTKHAVVLGYVQRMEEFKSSAVELSGNQRVIRYRDIILPLLSANELLGYEPTKKHQETLPVVVVQRAGEFYGIVVDEIVDTLSTMVDLSPSLVRHPGILGNLNTKEELIVVVDPFELISRAFPQEEQEIMVAASAPTPTASAQVLNPPNFAQAPQPSSGTPARILLVEDTVFFRKAIKTVLEKGGFEVDAVTNGEEALQYLDQKNKVDLIVSDIEMPKVNGFQLAVAVRKHATCSSLPMLAISSRADQKYMREGVIAGFDIYLEKLKPALLLEAVGTLLKKGRNVA